MTYELRLGDEQPVERVAVDLGQGLHGQGVPTDEIQTLLGHGDAGTAVLCKRNRRGVRRSLPERIRLGR